MLFNIILILLICVGIGLIIFACLGRKDNKLYNNSSEFDDAFKLAQQAISDADNAIEQINKLSSDVFSEFEEKYQELLFLYQMIDDLKQNFQSVDLNTNINNNNYLSDYDEKNYVENPDFAKIKAMYQKGLSISEISKVLGMGQGEVKLILDLGKGR